MTTLCAILTCLSLSVSAYTDADGDGRGITASGVHTRQGVVACGPSYDFGTVFIINGRRYTCKDRGSAITDGHIDIWHADEDAAWEWGRRQLMVVVIEPRRGVK